VPSNAVTSYLCIVMSKPNDAFFFGAGNRIRVSP
jgi:hypothetical protein